MGSNLFRYGADFPGWLCLGTPPERPETLSRALLDPLGRLESLSPWSMVLGPWSLVLGPWSLVLGSLVNGPWYHVLGFKNIVFS